MNESQDKQELNTASAYGVSISGAQPKSRCSSFGSRGERPGGYPIGTTISMAKSLIRLRWVVWLQSFRRSLNINPRSSEMGWLSKIFIRGVGDGAFFFAMLGLMRVPTVHNGVTDLTESIQSGNR